MSDTRVRICCSDCGSENVVRDAWAAWDIEKQEWFLDQAFDYAFCMHCERETDLIEKPVS